MTVRGQRLSRFALLCGAVLGLGLPEGAAQVVNHLSNARPEEWCPGLPPPRPWQYSEDVGVKVILTEFDNHDVWVELQDGSETKGASLRQEFPSLAAGRFSFRLKLAPDHLGDFGLYLGQGNASAPVERVVELKIATRGVLQIGSGGQREKTPVTFTPGASEWLYVDFRTVNGDLHLVLGRLGVPEGTPPLFETTLPQQGRPVTRLRLATDNAPRGGHVFVTDLVLTPAG